MPSMKTFGLLALATGLTSANTVTPQSRADGYHDDFAKVSKVFRGLAFPHTNVTAVAGTALKVEDWQGPYRVSLELKDPDDNSYFMKAQVANLPTAGVTGCQPLASFYTQVRDKLVATLPYAIDQMEENTGDQQELEGIRRDIEDAQKDVHAIEVFCGDLANMLRIRRNVYHAYTSAWGQIQFGDGTMAKRRLRTSEISHTDVIKRALSQMEHEPEVVVKLLQ